VTERATPAGGTGSGISYGCPCGQHVVYVASTAEAIAAVKSCPGKTDTSGAKKPAWLVPKPARADPERNT
jgi:hypothetical protein